MARVRLELPERFAFSTEIEVRITDLNYGRHLGNDALLGLLHEARARFLRAHGLGELDVEGAMLVVADVAIVYRAEGFAGDRLRIDVALGDLGRAGCDLFYRAIRLSDARVVAEAKTGLVFLDPATRKVLPLPAAIRKLAG